MIRRSGAKRLNHWMNHRETLQASIKNIFKAHWKNSANIASPYLHKSAERVKLFLGILIVVALAGNANANTVRNILHTLAPQELVELLVYPDVRCPHSLGGEFLDFAYSPWCSPFEGPGLNPVRENFSKSNSFLWIFRSSCDAIEKYIQDVTQNKQNISATSQVVSMIQCKTNTMHDERCKHPNLHSKETLVDVDGVLPGHDLIDAGTLLRLLPHGDSTRTIGQRARAVLTEKVLFYLPPSVRVNFTLRVRARKPLGPPGLKTLVQHVP